MVAKALLTYGYESRKLNDWIFKVRFNLSRSVTFEVNTKKEINSVSAASRSLKIITTGSMNGWANQG